MSKKKGNKAEWPETEVLTEECLRAHAGEVLGYVHFTLKSSDNKRGRDFWIKLAAFANSLCLQVKTSDNTETAGFVLPLPDPLPREAKISGRIRNLIDKHFKKHPDVPCIVFVGKPVHGKDKVGVIEDVWREIKKIFAEAEKRSLV